MIPHYIGNSPYCYANSVAMMLKDSGENIPPSLIEVLSGVSMGALWETKNSLMFFENVSNPPQRAIGKALRLLVFDFTEYSQESISNPPLDKLKHELEKSTAVVGPAPVDYISNPDGFGQHYIVIYGITDCEVLVNDPDGYPGLPIPIHDFELAWRAERIIANENIKTGYFHYWASPRRVTEYSTEQTYRNAIRSFKDIYETGMNKPGNFLVDETAIDTCADFIRNGPGHLEKPLLKCWFPAGARRALDYQLFFREFSPELSDIKEQQRELHCRCLLHGLRNEWAKVSDVLKQLAVSETEFKNTLFHQ